MSLVFLDRIDGAPLEDDDFSFSFNSWIANMVDTVNEDFVTVENAFNMLAVPSITQAELVAMLAAGSLVNGQLFYATTTNVFVGVANNALVQFTTAAYP